MKSRPYQIAAVDAIDAQLEKVSTTICVMPTGTGKTHVMAALVKKTPKRAIVLAHRKELVQQAADKIFKVTGHHPDIEMGELWARDTMWGKAPVVVSSVQTQNSSRHGDGRMCRFKPEEFSLLIVDECHHATGKSFRAVIDYYRQNKNIKVVGLTATPDRADNEALGQVFETVAFKYELRDAINDGWLVPIRQTSVYVQSLDFSAVRTTAGELNGADLAEVMEQEQNLHEIATPAFREAAGRKMLVFCVTKKQSDRMAEIFNRLQEGCARHVDCDTPDILRKELFDDFHAGKFQILCNVGITTEGWDGPTVEVICMARPTKSRSLYAQMVGRGTRPLAGVVDGPETAEERVEAIASSLKPYCEILDFVGNAGRHSLVSTLDILGGEIGGDAMDRVRKQIENGEAVAMDVIEALERAKVELAREQAEAAEIALRKKVVAQAKYSLSSSDPFELLGIVPRKAQGFDRLKQPSSKQKSLLEKQGIDCSEMTFTQVNQLAAEYFRRINAGECSIKQAKWLKKNGYDSHMSFRDASATMNAWAANGWKKPD